MTRDDIPLARSPLRLAGAGAALALTALTLLLARADERDRVELLRRTAELGVAGPPLARLERALEREADAGERRVAAARALVVARPADGAAEVAAWAERLAAAEALAAEALGALPASWEAAMVLGASRFERRQVTRDTRLFSAAREWELPLAAAVERSGGSPEVEQSLARAYLEVWPALSAEKRPLVEALLRRAFADDDFRRRHFDRWLAAAGAPARAEPLLPADSATAARLAGAAWRDGDAAGAVAWWRTARARHRAELEERLDGAAGAGEALERLAAAAPLGLDFAPLVERALGARAAGPGRPELVVAAARWLDWAEPLCLVGDCPFSPTALLRLGALARGVGTAATAFAALAGGDQARAELLARRSESLWSEAWAPYLLLTAKLHLANDETDAARLVLAEVHRTARSRPVYAALAAAAGAPRPAADDDPLARESWQPNEWRRLPRGVSLELGLGRPARGVTIAFHRPPARDLVLVAEWDGAPAAPLVVRASADEVELAHSLAPGLHLLRLDALAGALPELGVTTLR